MSVICLVKLVFNLLPVFFQMLVVLQALNMARDEIMWLVRHACTPPPKGKKLNQEDFVDP